MIFERDRPSCYASKDFSEVMESGGGSFVLAGFAGEAACLATAIDAFHRGHTSHFWRMRRRAMRSTTFRRRGASRFSGVAGLYGDTTTTRSWIARTSRKGNWRGLGDGNEHGRTA